MLSTIRAGQEQVKKTLNEYGYLSSVRRRSLFERLARVAGRSLDSTQGTPKAPYFVSTAMTTDTSTETG